MTTPTEKLSSFGVSIWLDDLSRERITSGGLNNLISTRNVVGVTTNPTIFAGALSNGESYQEQVAKLSAQGVSASEAVFEITTRDVADACDIFADLYQSSKGYDGRVSIEVEPGLANDTEGTINQAKQLFSKVNRSNVMIKIPATKAGLPAITEVIGSGISVNVTLIFSLERYSEVIDAYLAGLKLAASRGHQLAEIHSVASFFVSRVDTEIDKRLVAIGSPEALALKSKAAVANAQLAYQLFEQRFGDAGWDALAASGANLQRPLMASTGVKDPNLPDTLYVTELVGRNLVNTMPEKTLEAVFDHGPVSPDTISADYPAARSVIDQVEAHGISYREVTELLESEGVEKFIVSWNELLDTVSSALSKGH